MFGDGFIWVEPSQYSQLDDGTYTVAIDSVTEGVYSNGNHYLAVKVRIKDHPNSFPNTITLNDRPKAGAVKANGQPVTQDDLDNWDKSMSRFFSCFSFKVQEMNFKNVNAWKNKVGTVKCAPQYDKNEPDKKSKKYKELFPQVPQRRETPEQVQNIAKEVRGTVQQSDDVIF